jgi:hypothetical protein
MVGQRRIVLTISEDEELLSQWYDSMPPKVRSAMLRLLVTNALNRGMADGHLFLGVPAGIKNDQPSQSGQDPQKVAAEKQADAQNLREPKKVASPVQNVEARAPEGASKEELIAFTLAHLPEGATPEMREAAREYFKETPYNLADLTVVTKMYLAEKEIC